MRALLWGLVLSAGCGQNASMAPAPPPPPPTEKGAIRGGAYDQLQEAGDGAPAMAPMLAKPKPKGMKLGSLPPAAQQKKQAQPSSPESGQAVRSWFPEAFLWQPLVETGDDGTAKVDVKVPDTLTTWRVLALAHTRDGHQAGTVSTFATRLPLYVDPVVPGWLYAGDTLELPVQVVNASSDPVTAPLDVSTSGALTGQGTTTVHLGPGDSDVRWIPLAADGAGPAKVRATLGDADAAERTIPVSPAGRPVERTRGGLLSASRTFHLAGPAKADPRTQRLSVLVFPGPLAVVQAEVGRIAGGGAQPWDAAYGYAVAAHLEELANRTGAQADVDAKAVRKLRLLAWQRVVRFSRAPDAGTAADLLAGMKDVGDQELARTLRDRLVGVVVAGQRGDGTWARQASGSLQEVLVQTAFAARTLPDDEQGARLKASGALERYAGQVKDPYTAAVVLASGVLDGDLASGLRKVLVDGIHADEDGARKVDVPLGVLNPWGVAPTQAEALAWAALALADDKDIPWRGDLVAPIMAHYDASSGFGAGPADVIALQAITRLLPGLDKPVDAVLTLDGKEVARQKLDPSQPKEPTLLLAMPAGRDPEIELSADPAVPGLAFVATLDSWVPWTGGEALKGVEVQVDAPALQVGRDSTITLHISAPSGVQVHVEQGLPAGCTVDERALAGVDGLVEQAVHTDRVTLRTRPFRAGEVIDVPLVVRPAFAGRFDTAPLLVEAGGQQVAMKPMRWKVAREGALAAR